LSKPKARPDAFEGQKAELDRRAVELEKARAALEETARRSNEFLGALAHELRNPLAPIRNSLHILQLTCGSESATKESLDMIERQLHVLIRLIDDIHDLSRIARGNFRLQKERVALGALIQTVTKACQNELEAAGLAISVKVPSEEIYLEGDGPQLQHVFRKLLKNAVKFSDPGGQIAVTVERAVGKVVIHVRDTGLGIEPDRLEQVFERFNKSNDQRTRGRSGLGIGLSVARDLVQMHSGTIEAKSAGPGQGSDFLVTLPLASR
jgi:signal transduction histidine kinase